MRILPHSHQQAAIPPKRRPHPKHPNPPKPLLRLEFRDLSQAGAQAFIRGVDCGGCVSEAVQGVIGLLYSTHCDALSLERIPPTRSVTIVLRSMDGVAYTTGRDIDDDHKEIHFSTDYISKIPEERLSSEILGVLRHEMVHCFQFNARGTAPGGLIEGIADWVRLRSGLVPPHWKRECDGDWDSGYHRTAYFLEYLEERFGEGAVVRLNQELRGKEYDEEKFWKGLFGCEAKKLWEDYGKAVRGEGQEREDGHELAVNLKEGQRADTPINASAGIA